MAELLGIFLKLITDFRIILIFLAVILYLNFIIYISTYQKKPGNPNKQNRGRAKRSLPSAVSDMDNEITDDVGEIPDPD